MLPLPKARQLQLRDGARRTEHLDAHRSRRKLVATRGFWSSSVLVFFALKNTLVVILVLCLSLYFGIF